MTKADFVSGSLTEEQWNIAHAIAVTLVQEEADVNELSKAIAYLRNAVNQKQADAVSRFFRYLKTLVGSGRQIGHSGRTSDYYRSIERTCSKHLQQESNPQNMLEILGWTARLMRYYKDGGAIGEITTFSSNFAKDISTFTGESKGQFQVGQKLDAQVTNIKGKDVTYTMQETIKLTIKEPKNFANLSLGQTVKVEVTDLKEDGSPKKVRLVN